MHRIDVVLPTRGSDAYPTMELALQIAPESAKMFSEG
jgi:hypothetical protein